MQEQPLTMGDLYQLAAVLEAEIGGSKYHVLIVEDAALLGRLEAKIASMRDEHGTDWFAPV